MRRVRRACVLAAIVMNAWLGGGTPAHAKVVYQPRIDPADFQGSVNNPYFPLVPGTTFRFRETSGKVSNDNVITVTADTVRIMGIVCTVVHDVAKREDAVLEDTHDWFAQDNEGNVWYFGEATREFHGDGRVSTDGSWRAGVDGAQPGIVMPGHPAPAEPYRQEYYPGRAEDMGQVIAVGDSVTVPYGSFTACLRTKEWSLLEAGSETKWYAKGIGFVRSEASGEVSELVSVTRP